MFLISYSQFFFISVILVVGLLSLLFTSELTKDFTDQECVIILTAIYFCYLTFFIICDYSMHTEDIIKYLNQSKIEFSISKDNDCIIIHKKDKNEYSKYEIK